MDYENVRKPIFGISRHRMGIDGKGVTTLVAFMGCPLHCKYCINDKCHGSVYEKGHSLRKGVLMLSPKELYNVVRKDNIYFQATGGGVCFGGGEPTMNANFIIEFAKLIPKEWKITLETSLHCSSEVISSLAPYVDEWIVDIKDLDKSIYKNYTGISSDLIRQLHYMKEFVPLENVIVKVPLIPHFNTIENVKRNVKILREIGFTHIKEISYIEHITHITK